MVSMLQFVYVLFHLYGMIWFLIAVCFLIIVLLRFSDRMSTNCLYKVRGVYVFVCVYGGGGGGGGGGQG